MHITLFTYSSYKGSNILDKPCDVLVNDNMLHGDGVNIRFSLFKKLAVACMIQNVNWITPNTLMFKLFFLTKAFICFSYLKLNNL